MGFLDSLTKAGSGLSLVAKATSPAPATPGSRFSFQYLNGQAVLYDSRTSALVTEGYLVNSDLYKVVNYIMRKAVRARFFNYEVNDKKAFSDYIMLKGEGATPESLKEARLVRTKALVDTRMPEIDKLLARPNPEQNFAQFAEAAYGYMLLSGERFIQIVEGLEPVTNLWVLPSTLMEVKTGGSYMKIGGYKYFPTQDDLRPEEIRFSRTFNPSLSGYGDELRGLSPLRVLALTIQKSNEGKLSSVKQYQNAGPPGMLSLRDDSEPLTTEQALQYEALIQRKAGSAGRGRINVTGMEAKWTALGLSPVDLNILESGVYDLRDFAGVYGIASELVGDKASSTYNNMSEARKAAIVDAVIPLTNGLGDDLNSIIEPFNVKGKHYFIDPDVTHFPELSEDMNALADRLLKIQGLTPNQGLAAMQYETIDHPLMNEPWFDNTRTPLSQFGAMAGSGEGY